MRKPLLHIVILEASRVICEGLMVILYQSDLDCRILRVESLEDLSEMLESTAIDILIANPLQFVNREKEVRRIRKNHPSLSVAGIDYGIIQKQSMLADISFTLYDTPEHILQCLTKLDNKSRKENKQKGEDDNLTKREIEVLTGLVNGLMNKEIADSLHISIHTVVRHRKNITMKTGIRSQSGLTIYAISKKIVAIEDLEI